MTSNYLTELEGRIDNAVELTSICRNEWCRSLETEVDHLEAAVDEISLTATDPVLVSGLTNKLNAAYRNLGPTIRI